MGERKVLNKYYSPDFDPAKIPRPKRSKNNRMDVRSMLPMNIRCLTCGNFIYRGTKSKYIKEDAVGETYLGIKIFRLYLRCRECSAEIILRTDPQNSDYTVESGASRNFEPRRAEEEEIEAKERKRKRKAEEMGDALKSLENRALQSRREIDVVAALEELKSMKSRREAVSVDAMLEALHKSNQQNEEERKLPEEEEAYIRDVFSQRKNRRIEVDDDDDNLKRSSPPLKRSKVVEGVIPRKLLKKKTGVFCIMKKSSSTADGLQSLIQQYAETTE